MRHTAHAFEFEKLGPDEYRVIVRAGDGNIIEVLQRRDPHEPRVAKIRFFAYATHGLLNLDFDNPNIDRFLFS